MANVISLFNQAGGTGKTTLAMNLGYALTQQGHKVLLLDMDPQSSLTVFMGLQPHELEETIAQSILDRAPLPVLSD
ncbi:MAG: ParA family protein, partial [Leptolyngbyaceae cyanobacterium bins.302]|nr:ParA family protein [Leptolyngbyaceae cyanobacterium bins.302]